MHYGFIQQKEVAHNIGMNKETLENIKNIVFIYLILEYADNYIKSNMSHHIAFIMVSIKPDLYLINYY